MRLSALPQASHAADRIWLSDLQPWIIRIIGGLNGMAAKFEVYIVSGNYLSIQLCQAIFPHVGEIQFSGTCTVWDSWQPTKEIRVYLQDDKEMEACLSSGKILHFYGAAGPHMIGARQYFEYGVFCTELWIDTSRLPDLDTNMPNDFCNSFCQSVRRNMLGWIKQWR